MGDVPNVVADVSNQSRFHAPVRTEGLCEFERAQIRRFVANAADLAEAVVHWHHDASARGPAFLEERMAHGMAVAALGVLVMQVLAWVRLVETLDVPPATLRAAREVLDAVDPEVDELLLTPEALFLLNRAQSLKNTGRRISRSW